MRVFIVTVSLILTAGSAFAVPLATPVPAPLLAAGLPAAAVVGNLLPRQSPIQKEINLDIWSPNGHPKTS